MPLSEVDICNATLGALGIDVTITALTDTSREGVQCNRFYSIARDEMLELFPWNAVKKRARLVRDGGYFDLTGELTDPNAVTFRPNGMILYVLAGAIVYQYTMDNPWDISNAEYDSKTFDFSTEEATPTGIAFNPAGTKMYMVGTTDGLVEQYTLSTPWDVSTATVDAVQLDVSSEDATPEGITFGNSGLALYVVGNTGDAIWQYVLTTAYDLSTASYDSKTISVAVEDTSPKGVAFNSDGTKMYVSGSQSDAVHQYTLSTGWNVSTATTDSVDFQLVTDDNVLTGIYIDADGSRIFLLGQENDYIYHYGMAVGFDLATANSVDPNHEYDHQFTIPEDCYRVLKASVSSQAAEPQWEMEGRRIQSYEDKSLDIIYIEKMTDTDMFPPLFAKGLIYNLGVYLAMSLTNDSALQDKMEARRNAYISEAEKMTAREGNPDERPPWTAWQKRGRGSRRYPEVIN